MVLLVRSIMAVTVAAVLAAGVSVSLAQAQDGKVLGTDEGRIIIGRDIIRSPAFQPGPPNTVSIVDAPTSPQEWVLDAITPLDSIGVIVTDEIAAAVVANQPVSKHLLGALDGISGQQLQQSTAGGASFSRNSISTSGGAFSAVGRATQSIGPTITRALGTGN